MPLHSLSASIWYGPWSLSSFAMSVAWNLSGHLLASALSASANDALSSSSSS